MKAIWTGTIGFGLVNIPVKLYSASQISTTDLNMLNNKEHLCVLKPLKNVIVLNTLRYAEEIRDASELGAVKGTKPKPAELKMAMSLIDQLTGPFNLKKFKDTYSADLLKLIHAKAKTK